MTKELEFIRKTVIMACHPKCGSYGEALEKELVLGCKVILESEGDYLEYNVLPFLATKTKTHHRDNFRLHSRQKIDLVDKFGKVEVYSVLVGDLDEIIGQPITLSKVLLALGKIDSIYVEIDDYGHIWQTTAANVHSRKKVTEWDLTKDLDDQDSKTILSIAILLGYDK